MRSASRLFGLFSIFTLLFFAASQNLHAEDPQYKLKEGMTQGQFAQWLVLAIGGAENMSNGFHGDLGFKKGAAINENTAIDFLNNLTRETNGVQSGVAPKDGWQKKEVMTKDLLVSLLPENLQETDEIKNLLNDTNPESFDTLAGKVREYIKIGVKQGVWRINEGSTPFAII